MNESKEREIQMTSTEEMSVSKLTKDLKNASKTLSTKEARYLVDSYYQIQEYRKASSNQVRSLTSTEEPEPCETIKWLNSNMETLENQIKRALDAWTDNQQVGQWAKSITGIGPVITAGLLANIDITKAPTVGHIWRFAGLDPTKEWLKGEKRPWNASLKTLCWKIGESFVKVCNHKDDFYGHLYVQRKDYEIKRNDEGGNKEAAVKALLKKIGKDTDAYAAYSIGKLPPAHIHARAKRWAVKLFLAHLHHVWFKLHYGTEPPRPYVIEHMGHVDMIMPPNFTPK